MSGLPAEKYVAPDPAGTGIVEPVPDTAVIPEIRNLGIISVGVMEDRCLDVQTSDMALGRGHSHEGIFSPGKKRRPVIEIVWRCSSRLDYGKKYCKESPTLDEAPLQQAVLAAINASMSGRKVLADQLVDAMEQELAPVPGESMSLGDIDRAVTELGKQFDMLLAEAANGDVDEYAERFRAISTTMEELKRRKAAILSIRQEQEQIGRRIHAAASAMTAVTMGITEWDDGVVYQMLEKVTVLADSRIKVTFRNGVEIEQTVDQPKRRKFA